MALIADIHLNGLQTVARVYAVRKHGEPGGLCEYEAGIEKDGRRVVLENPILHEYDEGAIELMRKVFNAIDAEYPSRRIG